MARKGCSTHIKQSSNIEEITKQNTQFALRVCLFEATVAQMQVSGASNEAWQR